MTKVSVVITVLNEEKTIGGLLEALLKQSKKPDEVIFVDGGSTDATASVISNFQFPISNKKTLVKPGTTIAQGRNAGIKEASGEIIAMTDGGCIPHQDWFEKITQPFSNPEIDVVAGFYKMTGDSVFQKCLACYLGVLPEKLDPENFLPSARSIAFKKEIWQKVGGFSEKLERAGEDTLFNYQAKKSGARFATAPDALVDWELPKTLGQAMKKFYIYASGDVQARYWPHVVKIALVFFRYGIGIMISFISPISFIIIIISYFSWAVWKNYRYVKHPLALFYLPILQIMADLAVMGGTLNGIFKTND